MNSPPPEFRHRAWSLFGGACVSIVGGWIIQLSTKHPEGERLGAALLGSGVLLVGVWLIFAAVSGRIPEWLQNLIDDPD